MGDAAGRKQSPRRRPPLDAWPVAILYVLLRFGAIVLLAYVLGQLIGLGLRAL